MSEESRRYLSGERPEHETEIEAEERSSTHARTVRFVRKSSFPSGDELTELNRVGADFAERAFRMAEKAQEAKIAENRRILRIELIQAVRELVAPFLSFGLLALVTGFAFKAIFGGQIIPGTLTVVLELIGVFAAYFQARRNG